ncbi:MAG: hypothetical protein M3075_06930 [Candidatus Dormibacteraeota bacterium]|nr:hypothetical protein [Candidatus Dormibacteraeota bacterium]
MSPRGTTPAPGGGISIQVAPDRLTAWLAGFDRRHAVTRTQYSPALVRLLTANGPYAECEPPFPPLPVSGEHKGLAAGPLVAHVERVRVVGVLLARLGGYAAGVFDGDRLLESKVGSRPVHGRSAAGGSSQQRFARRREQQARQALAAAADNASAILLPQLPRLEAVVLGGDRRAIDALRDDRRLAPLFALAADRFLSVPDPRLAVLRKAPVLFRAVQIRLIEREASE